MPQSTYTISLTANPSHLTTDTGLLNVITINFIGPNKNNVPSIPHLWRPAHYAAADILVQLHPDYQVIGFTGNAEGCILTLATEQVGFSPELLTKEIEQILEDHPGICFHLDPIEMVKKATHYPALRWMALILQMIHRNFPVRTHCGPNGQGSVSAGSVTDTQNVLFQILVQSTNDRDSTDLNTELERHLSFTLAGLPPSINFRKEIS